MLGLAGVKESLLHAQNVVVHIGTNLEGDQSNVLGSD